MSRVLVVYFVVLFAITTFIAACHVAAQSRQPSMVTDIAADSLMEQARLGTYQGDWIEWADRVQRYSRPAAFTILQHDPITIPSYGSSYALAWRILQDRPYRLAPSVVERLRRLAFTTNPLIEGSEIINLLIHGGWKPTTNRERVLVRLTELNPDNVINLGSKDCAELVSVYHDTTHRALRGQTLTALHRCRCRGPEVIAVYSDALESTLPCEYNLVVTIEASRGLRRSWPASRIAVPLLIDRIGRGDVSSTWLMFRDPTSAEAAFRACLAGIDSCSYEAIDRYREAIDDYVAQASTDSMFWLRIGRIPDHPTRAMVRMLARSRHSELAPGEQVLTDSQLSELIRSRALYPSVQQELSSISRDDVVALNAFDDATLKKCVDLLITVRPSRTGAAGNLYSLLSEMRLIELANRSSRIRALIRQGHYTVNETVEVSFPWNQEHYPEEGWHKVIVRMPRLRR